MRKMIRASEKFRRARALLCAAVLVSAALGASCGTGGSPGVRDATPPQRIISLTPSTTEILAGVGAFSRVVAVSNDCSYPPEVKSLPRVGGWTNTNLEQLASLRPDL